jgi:hypothetical protein
MTKPMRTLLLFSLLLILGIQAQAQIPVDNPYRSRFNHVMPAAPFHWTDSIRWDVIVNINDYANLVKRIKDPGTLNDEDSLNDWKDAFYAAQTALVNAGGGVLYFPKLPQRYDGPGGVEPGKDSAYFFSDHLFLKSNVILRGETPAPNQMDARLNTFAPPTYFEFPLYNYTGTNDVPNSTAFKEITVDTAGIVGRGKPGFRNIGIVYIDINRGRFAAHPTFRDTTIGSITYSVAVEKPRNVLVLGMRSNNVAIPDLSIPSAILPASKTWHRWPWRFAANVDVYVAANCIVAGCRMNDYQNNARNNLRRIQDNSFPQAGYVPNPATNQPACFPSPDQAKFNYNNHYGIILNRLKKTGYNTTKGFVSNASPQQEPELYAPGNEVVDCWVYKTSRVGIHAAGLGLKIKGNVIEDSPTKETSIGPTGASCLNASYPDCNTPTFENRGIDFCGWGVTIDSNTTTAYRVKLLPSDKHSSDGEGWYFQGASGSTARDITITRNKFIGNFNGLCDVLCNTNINKGYNGFANSSTIQNVVVRDNDFGNIPFRIRVDGDNPQNYTINGLQVFKNTKLHSIEVYAKGCGSGSYVYKNTKTSEPLPNCNPNPADLRIDCFTSLDSNMAFRNENSNVGFSTWPSVAGDDRTGCGNPCPTGGPSCGFPTANITDPTGAINCFARNAQVIVTVDYSLSDICAPDSVVLFKKAGVRVEKVDLGLAPGSGQAIFSTYSTPATAWVSEPIYAVAYKSGYSGQSVNYLIKECVAVQDEVSALPGVILYPNPARSVLYYNVANLPASGVLRLRDVSGRILVEQSEDFNQQIGSLQVQNLSPGLYFVEIQSEKHTLRRRIVLE